MNAVFLSVTLGVMLAATVFTLQPQLHMLQLNSYFNSRFIDYLKTAASVRAAISALIAALCAVLCFFAPLWAMVAAILTSAVRVVYAVYKIRHAKKKIVYTGRVKRMIATWVLVCAVVALVCALSGALEYGIVAAAVMTAAIPWMAMLANLLNAPLENGMKRWYINDAKRILKSRPDLKIIGLTGSYGKTSTKHILGRMLSEKYNVMITPGGVNTTLGVVRTIREQLKPDAQIFVVEMGAKKTGDIREICELVHPDTGIITSIGPQHLNTFGSIENIIHTKFELADEVQNNGGMLYLNLDNPYIAAQSDGYTYKGYGVESPDCAVSAKDISVSRHGLSFTAVAGGREIPISTKLLGMHNVLNILAAVAVCSDLGLSDTDIRYAANRLTPVEHRLQMKPFYNGAILIDDAYNANPAGSLEALRVLGSFAPMKRIVVTPGLVELGVREADCNRALGEACAEYADQIIFVGQERSKPLLEGAQNKGCDLSKIQVVKTFSDAAVLLRTMCDQNTAVLFENDLPDNYER